MNKSALLTSLKANKHCWMRDWIRIVLSWKYQESGSNSSNSKKNTPPGITTHRTRSQTKKIYSNKMLAIILHSSRASSRPASIQRIIIRILATTTTTTTIWWAADSTRIAVAMWISRTLVQLQTHLFLLTIICSLRLQQQMFHHHPREFKARDFCVLSVSARSRASIRSSWFHWRNSSGIRINSTVIGHHWKAISTRRSIQFSAITRWISMRISLRSTGPAVSLSVSSLSSSDN